LQTWLLGARLRTLPASIVPVIVGTAAVAPGPIFWDRAVLALIVAMSLQIGCNYANDYSDGIRGTDRDRTGPPRLVASGLASPGAVKRAAMTAFGVALLAGIVLSLQSDVRLIIVGCAAIAAAWAYTGGRNPYGYRGLGEVAVFVFFGLVGTLGSAYVQHQSLSLTAIIAALGVGALATALLVVNNLRDIPTDAASGKVTLAVRIGDVGTRRFYTALIACAALSVVFLSGIHRPTILALAAFGFADRPLRRIFSQATGAELIPVLVDTGKLELAFGVLLALGFALPG
jgi:1,4-dihydroxy-2-naphthoate octaprenyltransferase